MVMEFVKGEQVQLSDHFTSLNFDCRCNLPSCSHTLIDVELVSGLELLYRMVNGLWLTSGFRCHIHNRQVGGEPGGFHLNGKAADVQSHTPASELADLAEQIEFFKNGGIGRAKNFTHLDRRGYPARWSY